jgi:predicted CXXCH cytochrome family protein
MFFLTRFRTASLLVAVALATVAWSVGAAQLAEGSKALEAESCIRPTDDMRRNHMEYINHDRHLVVRDGIRNVEGSLAGCVNCHGGHDASGKAVPVNAEGQFCSGCHEYTGISITCFQCHRKVPEEK